MIPTNQQGSFNESTLFDRKAVSKQQGLLAKHSLLIRGISEFEEPPTSVHSCVCSLLNRG